MDYFLWEFTRGLYYSHGDVEFASKHEQLYNKFIVSFNNCLSHRVFELSTFTTQLYDINPIRSQFDPKTRKYTNEWKSEQSCPNEEDFYHLISAVRKMTSFELVLPSKMNFFVLQVVKRVEKSSRCYSS